jgi:hypothetical protein
MEGMVNQYLEAMVAHNPFGLPLAERVRFTENEQTLELGDGLWNNVTKVGAYKLLAVDRKEGQVGFLGTVEENEVPVALALRLKVDKRKIREIETLVVRDERVAAAIEKMGKPDPLFTQTEASGARLNRGKMTDAIDLYFEAVEQGVATKVPFDSECNRIQNGTKTTNNDALPMPELTWSPFALGCAAQLDTKYFNFVDRVYPRRYAVIDEERQLVFGFFLFQIPGNITSIESPKGKVPVPEDYQHPVFIDVAEVYKLSGGKIRRIEAIQTNIPYGMNSAYFADDWRRGPKKIEGEKK